MTKKKQNKKLRPFILINVAYGPFKLVQNAESLAFALSEPAKTVTLIYIVRN